MRPHCTCVPHAWWLRRALKNDKPKRADAQRAPLPQAMRHTTALPLRSISPRRDCWGALGKLSNPSAPTRKRAMRAPLSAEQQARPGDHHGICIPHAHDMVA